MSGMMRRISPFRQLPRSSKKRVKNALTQITAESSSQASGEVTHVPHSLRCPSIVDRSARRITGQAGNGMVRQAIFERLKRTMMVWLAVFPIVLLVISLAGDCMKGWPLPLRVLGATLMIVPIVTNISEPAVRTVVGIIQRSRLRRELRARPRSHCPVPVAHKCKETEI